MTRLMLSAIAIAGGFLACLGPEPAYRVDGGAGAGQGGLGSAGGGSGGDAGAAGSGASGGQGGALLPLGEPCEIDAQCQSGKCSAQLVCCDGWCDFGCESCLAEDTGKTQGVCEYVPPYEDPLSDCGPSQACDGSGSCALLDGQPCMFSSECVSFNCNGTSCVP